MPERDESRDPADRDELHPGELDRDQPEREDADRDGSERNPAAAKEPARDEPEQIRLMQRMVDLAIERTRQSAERTRQSAERSELSAERSYMNAERTLSVWIRTALAVIVVGIAVDRFGLLLAQDHATRARSDSASHWVGAGLVAFGILVSVVTGARFWLYAAVYRRTHELPHHHGPFMAPAFAALAALFGIIILILVILSP